MCVLTFSLESDIIRLFVGALTFSVLCVCTCVCLYIYTYIHTYTHTYIYRPENEGCSRINRSTAGSIISKQSLFSSTVRSLLCVCVCVCVCVCGSPSVCAAQRWSWTGPCSTVHQWTLWSPDPVWRGGCGPPPQRTWHTHTLLNTFI